MKVERRIQHVLQASRLHPCRHPRVTDLHEDAKDYARPQLVELWHLVAQLDRLDLDGQGRAALNAAQYQSAWLTQSVRR